MALHTLQGRADAELAIVVSDGSDLDQLSVIMGRVRSQQLRVLLIGGDPAMLAGAFPGVRVQAVHDDAHPALLWRNLCHAFDTPSAAPPPPALPPRLFLSHATVDEARIQPAVSLLRRLGIEVFVCGDSIRGGERWWDTILDALHDCDRFVLVLSDSARRSSWCAFEAGAAVALRKPLRLLSLDGAPPPSFVGHLQMFDVPRAIRSRPWMTVEDALVEALIAQQ